MPAFALQKCNMSISHKECCSGIIPARQNIGKCSFSLQRATHESCAGSGPANSPKRSGHAACTSHHFGNHKGPPRKDGFLSFLSLICSTESLGSPSECLEKILGGTTRGTCRVIARAPRKPVGFTSERKMNS